MTQLESAREGRVTKAMERVAADESLPVEELMRLIAEGRVVIPLNPLHASVKPVGIGERLRTKVNVNLGSSEDFPEAETELEKVDVALEYRADAVMDLSTGGDINEIRRRIIDRASIPLGTVPIYQAAIKAIAERGAIVHMTDDDLFSVIEQQAREGVDFMTVHAGLTTHAVNRLRRQGRVADVVSRGGSFHLALILHNGRENPFYEKFDRLLEIAREFDVTLSLGDGLRPGALADATDRPQIEELLTLGELVKRAWEAGVQVMVEGPGHVPLDQIEMNVRLQKRVCHDAPFYVLGPLVTDIAPGYDHIVAAIGGAVAASAGADFLCYVTPSEHLGLPSVEDVREGTIASRIAAHAADIVKGVKGAAGMDLALSRARRQLDWDTQRSLVIDPRRFDSIRDRRASKSDACSMCGDYCALKMVDDFLKAEAEKKDGE